MEKSKDEEIEFEDLFDYRRVQPISFVTLDDDSDSEKPLVKRLKKDIPPPPLPPVATESCNVVNEIVCDEEDDWLPPPPKDSNDERKLEDSTLKELRLKKQELASFAQSAEDVLRAVEESARKQLARSLQPSSGTEAEKLSKPPDDRVKIVISIQDKDGQKQFRLYKDEKFERLFKMYAEKVKCDVGSLVFSFDGDKVSATASPSELDMEDEDIIEVRTKSK